MGFFWVLVIVLVLVVCFLLLDIMINNDLFMGVILGLMVTKLSFVFVELIEVVYVDGVKMLVVEVVFEFELEFEVVDLFVLLFFEVIECFVNFL